MASPRYGLVTDIRNMPALSQLQSAGITPLFGGNDPGGIAAIQAAMAAAQGNAGLWIPADSRGVTDYVQHVKNLLQAVPAAKHIDLNIEAIGKGYPGTPGWDYTEQVLQQLSPYLQGRSWSASPTGLQDDFNYGAVVSRGGQVWPQAYMGDMSGIDPQTIYNRVLANKVPGSRITPLLGNAGQAGFGHLYGIDLPGFRDPQGRLMMNPNADPFSFAEGAGKLAAGPAPAKNYFQLPPAARGALYSKALPMKSPMGQFKTRTDFFRAFDAAMGRAQPPAYKPPPLVRTTSLPIKVQPARAPAPPPGNPAVRGTAGPIRPIVAKKTAPVTAKKKKKK